MGDLRTLRSVALRTAEADDADCVFEWRNNSSTRRFFFDPKPLSRANHEKWFQATLKDPATALLIAVGPDLLRVGVIRFDFTGNQSAAEVSIFVDPGRVGEGWGSAILRAGITWIRKNRSVCRLTARVVRDNLASLRMFEQVGFKTSYSLLSMELADIQHA